MQFCPYLNSDWLQTHCLFQLTLLLLGRFFLHAKRRHICIQHFYLQKWRHFAVDSLLRQTANVKLYHVTKLPPLLSFTVYYFYTKISSFTPVLSIRTVLDGFYLLIFCAEKLSTWISRLPFAVNVTLNLSNTSNRTAPLKARGRGRGTPLYLLYRGYVPPQSVWFLRRFGLKTGIFWTEFWCDFRGNAWMYLSFQFQMNTKERVICEFEVDFK